MTRILTAYAKAAQTLPMAWLTQGEFPAKSLVETSFHEALDELPAPAGYQDNLVRFALESIIAGPDPRGGSFRAQAIHAAAKLHDRVTALALEPKVKRPKVRKGSVLHGYCGGLLGDSYGHRLVTGKGEGWINYRIIDGDFEGVRSTYNGDVSELAEYLTRDEISCPENCTQGQD